MGIFTPKTKAASTTKATKEPKKKATTVSASETEVQASETKPAKTVVFSPLLRSPRVTEKAAVSASKGSYVFNVPTSANKIEIRKAVEAMYKVKVTDVRTIRGQGKIVRRGRVAGRRNAWKKAIVSLKKGQTIDLYKGV